MPPTRQPQYPVPGRIYTVDEARAINDDWIMYGTTGTYHGWENAYTGNPVMFGPVGMLPPAEYEDKAAPVKPKKMVDRSQDWKKGGRK